MLATNQEVYRYAKSRTNRSYRRDARVTDQGPVQPLRYADMRTNSDFLRTHAPRHTSKKKAELTKTKTRGHSPEQNVEQPMIDEVRQLLNSDGSASRTSRIMAQVKTTVRLPMRMTKPAVTATTILRRALLGLCRDPKSACVDFRVPRTRCVLQSRRHRWRR